MNKYLSTMAKFFTMAWYSTQDVPFIFTISTASGACVLRDYTTNTKIQTH
jgi:hypothetical protein